MCLQKTARIIFQRRHLTQVPRMFVGYDKQLVPQNLRSWNTTQTQMMRVTRQQHGTAQAVKLRL